MQFIYPINFVGHDEWMESGYALNLSSGDVITRDGVVLGKWRVAAYNPEFDHEGGQYEFIADGQDSISFSEGFGVLDSRANRGFALSNLTRKIKQLYDAEH
ncbi:hypothetical protein [Ahrensia sp. 13_GOM-1096m]|uniref:hypothetical protein n=1 Tax=Ahrensia sp. 13_GOM-1096m TaxID=1380380 RepID=UPI000479BCB3|nr:hypothetical protein [Ahrensia sp. 13_GOM-1096m]